MDELDVSSGFLIFIAISFFICGMIFVEINTGVIETKTLDLVCQKLMNDPNATFIEEFFINKDFKCEVVKTRVLNLKSGD